MNGLEAVEVNHLQVSKETALMLEAEYYISRTESNIKNIKGEDVIEFVQYGTSVELNEEGKGFPVLRLNEFDSYYIGNPAKFCDKISNQEFENLKLKKGDVLICRTNGNPNLVGRSAIVMDDTNFAYASYLFKVRPKKEIISSECLMIFLRSKYGRKQIDKYSMTSNQTNFSPAKFREIDIPIFSTAFQNHINEDVLNAYKLLRQSQFLYTKSQTLLLIELGLQNWKPTQSNTEIQSFKNSFLQSSRLDAEYYEPKYYEIIEKIKQYANGHDCLKNVCTVDDKNYNPMLNQQYKYVELSNIDGSGSIGGCMYELGANLPTRARKKIRKGDIIVSSIEGSLQSCALVTLEYDEALCSTGFYVLKSDKINSESLLVLFKSPVLQLLLKQNCSGTILTSINRSDLDKIVLPIIKQDVQQQIAQLIQQSFLLKKQSQQLLNIAKQAVEKAIEINEGTAIQFINENVIDGE
jgi:restriction endonuclease S subunit